MTTSDNKNDNTDESWVAGRIKTSYNSFSYKKLPNGLLHIDLNRIKEHNVQNKSFYEDILHFFKYVNYESDIRVIMITSSAKGFSSGVDVAFLSSLMTDSEDRDQARKSLLAELKIKWLQKCLDILEKCRFPIIVGVHRYCIGASIDFISACDIVYCTDDTRFSIKEVDLAIVADLGTLARIPY